MGEFRAIPPRLTRNEWNALLDHGLEKPCSFIIFKRTIDGTDYYYAQYGTGADQAGKIAFGGPNNVGNVNGTDASAVIQAAINAAPSGGTVFIKSGIYILTSKVLIEKPLSLVGESSAVLKVADNTTINAIEIKSNDVIVELVTVDGNRANNPTQGMGYAQCGIAVLGSAATPRKNIIIRGCKIVNTPGPAVFFDDHIYESIVAENMIENCNEGILLMWSGNHDNLIMGNVVKDMVTYNGIIVSDGYRNAIIGNTVVRAANNGVLIDGVSYMNEVIGNVVSECFIGIAVKMADTSRPYGNIFEGNVAHRCKEAGIVISRSDYNLITGNYVFENSQQTSGNRSGIEFWGTSTERSVGNVVHGNIVRGNSHKHGIDFAFQDYGRVAENYVISATLDGIQLYDSDYCLIHHNHSMNNGRYGIRLNPACSNNIVLANYLSGNTQAQLYDEGTGNKKAGNIGYVTENSGTATITAGNTYVDVTHGLSITPDINRIRIVPIDNLSGRSFWVSNVGATTFRINISSADTVDHSFGWSYE